MATSISKDVYGQVAPSFVSCNKLEISEVIEVGNQRAKFIRSDSKSAIFRHPGLDVFGIGQQARSLFHEMLGDDVLDDAAFDVGESEVAPRVSIGELFMIEAE